MDVSITSDSPVADSSRLMAKLEAHARKLEVGDMEMRALPKIFRTVPPLPSGLLSVTAVDCDSPSATRPGTAAGGVGDMSLLARHFGLCILQEVYDEACSEYLEQGGVYDLLDVLAVADVVHPSQRSLAAASTPLPPRDGSFLKSPANQSSSSPVSASMGGANSSATSPPPKLVNIKDLCPTLPLVSAVERYRAWHPSSHSLDVVHARALRLFQELDDEMASSEFLAQIEQTWILRRPTVQQVATWGVNERRGSSVATSAATSEVGAASEPSVALLGSMTSTSAAHFASASEVSNGSALSSSSSAEWTVCGFTLNTNLEHDIEGIHMKLFRIEKKVKEFQDALESIDSTEKSLVIYPWSQQLLVPSASHFPRTPPMFLQALGALSNLLRIADITQRMLKELMQVDKSWVLCLNDNLKFLKREWSCAQLPRMAEELTTALATARQDASCATSGNMFAAVRWLLTQSSLIRDAQWVLDSWERSRDYLVYLQRLLVAQIETFTIVLVEGDDGQASPQRQITTTPTTRFDRLYSERRSVLAWGALCLRRSFLSWEDLREAPLHRVSQQLKKMKLETKTTFEVCMVLLASQLELGPGMPSAASPDLFDAPDFVRTSVAPLGTSVKDFLDEEYTMFSHERRYVKFTAATVQRK